MSVSLIKRSKIWSAAWLDGAQTNIRPLCQRSRGADMAETTNCTRNEVFPVPGGPCTMENGFCKPRCTANCCFSFNPACSTRAADFRITWLTSELKMPVPTVKQRSHYWPWTNIEYVHLVHLIAPSDLFKGCQRSHFHFPLHLLWTSWESQAHTI